MKRCAPGWLLAVALYAVSLCASAHNTPIAVLKIYERQGGLYKAEWLYSTNTNQPPPPPVFPSHCVYDYPKLDCGERGLFGTLSMRQLGERYSAAVVQITRKDGHTQNYTLTGAAPSVLLTQDGTLALGQVAASYIPLGFEHILLGVDHLLFVLGLMMLVNRPSMLVKTITSFTVAHSITLAAATFGWVGVPERAVNAAIALSIVFVAVEVLKYRRGEYCLSARVPWAIAFGFGLLHGFGFAGALTKIGLPAENLPAALLFFNVGVEIGQLCFVLVVLALYWCHRVLTVHMPRWSESAAVYGMGAIASFWFLSRFGVMLTGP